MLWFLSKQFYVLCSQEKFQISTTILHRNMENVTVKNFWKHEKLILSLIFYHQSHIWKNSGSRFMGQNADNQSLEKRGMKLFLCLLINTKLLKDEGNFLPADKRQWFPQIDTIILSVWPGMPKLPKITSLLFLCNILRKKWVMKLISCMPTSMKACYKLILWL